MIGLVGGFGSGYFSGLYGGGEVGLSGPVGMSNTNDGGGSAGLSGGVGLSYETGAGSSVGLNGGVGLLA